MSKFACVVPNCKMRTWSITPEQKKLSLSEYLVSFHKFPPDRKRQERWKKSIGLEKLVLYPDSVVCSLHFRGDCYDNSNKLLDSAVPTIVFADFESHLKLILNAIEKEKSEADRAGSDGNQNLNSKEMKNCDEDEFGSCDSDFEIECEEIILSGDSDDEKTNEVSKPKESVTTARESTVGSSQSPKVNLNPENLIACEDVEDVPESSHSSSPNVSAPSTKSTAVSSVPQSSNSTVKENTSASKTSKSELPTKLPPQNNVSKSNSSPTVSKPDATSTKPDPPIPKLHNISTKEDTSDQARQLYSMIQSGSFQNFSVMHPSSKNLVRQLLDIVKLANSKSDASASGEENIPNSYIITTKYDDKESSAKVKLVETDEVISMVNQTVQAIKDGTYEKTDDIVIICGSPAIFLIKNVSVKSFDPNMNSVYVITSENLISYLYILSTQAKPPRKIAAKTTETVAPTVSSAAKSSPQTTPSSIPAKILPKPQSTPISPIVSNTISPIPSVIAKTSATVASSSLNITSELVRNHLTAAKAPTLNAAASIAPLGAGTPLQVSTVAGTTPTRPPAITPKSTSVVSSGATLKNSQLVTSISSPMISSHFLATPACIPTVVIPSKSSAFQIPQMTIATPIGTMRNNIVTLKHTNTTPKPTKESNSVPSLILAQLPSSAVTSVPTVSNPLTKTNLVKLTLPPSVTVSKSIPAQLLKSSLPTQQPIRATVVNDAGKLSLAFDSLKRKTDDLKGPQSSPKRPAFGENSNKWILPNVTPDIARSPSPEVPSPLGDDNVNSDEERPLSPRAAQRRLATQRSEIRSLEQKIIKKERDILALRKKIPVLRKRCSAAKKTSNSKSDEQLVEDILKKYFDNDAVHLFVGQMKVAGKTFTQFRWTEEDKLFALSLLYRNPVEYNMLVQKFTLPSDKTLHKFVARIKNAEMGAKP